MAIKVEFFATLREVLGTNSVELDYAVTVGDLINMLIERFGQAFREAVMEGSRIKEMVKILVNGRDIRERGGLETELRDGDCVSIFPPVAGG
ncbi:MAG: MoaD/ThiS family protein [Candidatus Methanomethyliaceae archaeon]|nr:MoaD/ThiS family protein [Candidatus Methanomethyliaceae archaeon]